MRQLCEQCGCDEPEIALTPIHIFIRGVRRTVFFHNTKEKRCLEQWLRDQRTLYAATQN